MAISISGNPYSVKGAAISGLVATDYWSGKAKYNYGELMPSTLPDFSGMKIETMSDTVLSLNISQDSVSIENNSIVQINSNDESIKTIQPFKMYNANTTGITIIEPKYTLHGVEFTSKQIQSSTNFLEEIAQIMRDIDATSGTLDYDDYAVMGLSESQIRKFGDNQGFSDEQIKALITDYRNTLKELIKQNLSNFPFDKQTTHLPQSKYFFTYYSENKDSCKQTLITCPEMAINYDMIQSIYNTFANVDNEASLKNAVSQLKEQATIARKAGLPASNNEWINWRVDIYEENINKFVVAANDLQTVMQQDYPHLDINI